MSSGLAPLSDDGHVGTRAVGAVVGAMLLVSGCSTDEEPEAKAKAPSKTATPTTSTSPSPSPSAEKPAAEVLPPVEDKVSLAALMREDFTGGRIRVRREVLANDEYTRSEVNYPSGDVTISGVLLRPRGHGPFPAVVLNHGHIEPSIYVTGQGLMREQDYLARAGFVVLHTDYRGHAASDPASDQSIETRLGYTRDTINAVESVKKLRYVDPDKVAMLGRSMGGGVTYNALVVKPGLVRAGVVFAPVSSDFVDNFNRWTVAERPEAAAATYRRYGTPDARPDLLPRPVCAHVLRPDHRTGADPPRHRRRVVSRPVVPRHPATVAKRQGSTRDSRSTRASTTPSVRSGRCPWSGPCGSSAVSSVDDACCAARRGANVAAATPRSPRMTISRNALQSKRLQAVRAWTNFVEHGDWAEGMVRPEILRSWERSAPAVGIDVTEAPLADESDTRSFWDGSPLQVAVERVEQELRRTAEDGDLVVAVTDAQTRILWTYGGRVMRRKAETVNFVAGGRWDDTSVGTNALDLATRNDAAVDGVQCRALRRDRAQLGLLGGAGARPGQRRAARRDRPLHHLGPHAPDRARHRAGDGSAHRDRDAALRAAPGTGRPERRAGGSRPAPHPARCRGGHLDGRDCSSTGARPRSSRCWR